MAKGALLTDLRAQTDTYVSASPPSESGPTETFAQWHRDLRRGVSAAVNDFVANRCTGHLADTGVDVAAEVLQNYVAGGKCFRSTFAYLGWLSAAEPDGAALCAAASFELLHAFALLQDDVMDGAAMRRGGPSAHVVFARWHRGRALPGSAERFGESAAVLLGDLCLVWAEQMLRESGLEPEALDRVRSRYDAMRVELAVGQFTDLINDAGAFPALDRVLEMSRRKSGNYTVRRPLEIGATLAGCEQHVVTLLSGYGEALGDAFQLRDDLLGIFGCTSATGKPVGGDLSEHKATSVVVAAHTLAGPALRHQLREVMSARELDDEDVRRWRGLITATGAVEWVEQLISSRLDRALAWIDSDLLDSAVRQALTEMAAACTDRAA